MEQRQVMITTLDNPYDYFDDFDNWLMFDKENGYNTCEYLARVSNITDDMTDSEEIAEIERAIDEIIELNPLPIYKKVEKLVPIIEPMDEKIF